MKDPMYRHGYECGYKDGKGKNLADRPRLNDGPIMSNWQRGYKEGFEKAAQGLPK